jgi:hypothetical protein
VIGTPGYKDRFDGRKGGTGYEGHIIAAAVLAGQHGDKFIPVLRSGDWTTSLPTALGAVMGVDLRGAPYLEVEYRRLVRKLHGVAETAPPVGTPPEWLKSEDRVPSLGSTLATGTEAVPTEYLREVLMWSVTDIERSSSQYWHAAESAVLKEVAWPLSVYWFQHTHGDKFVRREPTNDGFWAEYQQHDALVSRTERIDATNPGKVFIRETQEFPSRYRNGGFPYDIAIGTAADAIRFAISFFDALGVGGANTIGIRMTWNGIKGRFITADGFSILPSYEQKRSTTSTVHSPDVQFRLADGERLLVENVRRLLGPLFSQFDMFDPREETYTKVLEHWRSVTL